MTQLAKLLEEKLQSMKDELIEAQRIAKEANDRADSLAIRVDAYRKALAAETGEGTIQPEAKEEEVASGGDGLGSEINKSQIVRDIILARAEQGATTKDIREAFRKAGINIHPNYPYSIIARLKRNRTIREVRGKYFPMEPKKVGE